MATNLTYHHGVEPPNMNHRIEDETHVRDNPLHHRLDHPQARSHVHETEIDHSSETAPNTGFVRPLSPIRPTSSSYQRHPNYNETASSGNIHSGLAVDGEETQDEVTEDEEEEDETASSSKTSEEEEDDDDDDDDDDDEDDEEEESSQIDDVEPPEGRTESPHHHIHGGDDVDVSNDDDEEEESSSSQDDSAQEGSGGSQTEEEENEQVSRGVRCTSEEEDEQIRTAIHDRIEREGEHVGMMSDIIKIETEAAVGISKRSSPIVSSVETAPVPSTIQALTGRAAMSNTGVINGNVMGFVSSVNGSVQANASTTAVAGSSTGGGSAYSSTVVATAPPTPPLQHESMERNSQATVTQLVGSMLRPGLTGSLASTSQPTRSVFIAPGRTQPSVYTPLVTAPRKALNIPPVMYPPSTRSTVGASLLQQHISQHYAPVSTMVEPSQPMLGTRQQAPTSVHTRGSYIGGVVSSHQFPSMQQTQVGAEHANHPSSRIMRGSSTTTAHPISMTTSTTKLPTSVITGPITVKTVDTTRHNVSPETVYQQQGGVSYKVISSVAYPDRVLQKNMSNATAAQIGIPQNPQAVLTYQRNENQGMKMLSNAQTSLPMDPIILAHPVSGGAQESSIRKPSLVKSYGFTPGVASYARNKSQASVYEQRLVTPAATSSVAQDMRIEPIKEDTMETEADIASYQKGRTGKYPLKSKKCCSC